MSRTNLLLDADVRTLDAAGTRAEAVAWRDGRILAVGAREEVARAAGPGADRWDAGGATVVPGFIDAHHHPGLVALWGGAVRLVPPAVRDVASLQAALAAAVAASPGSAGWLLATDWNEQLLAERRPPTRAELDEAVPDRPLLAMHYTCHRALANSRALEAAGIGRHTPDPAGGAISRGRGGVPDGLLLERGMSRVEALARASLATRDAEGFFDRLARHHRALAAAGITRVVDATVPPELAALYREAARRGGLLVPTVMMPVSASGFLEEPWDALEGEATGVEDGPLAVGPLKLVFDGAPACAMCLGWWQAFGLLVRTWALSLRRWSLDPVRTALSVRPRVGADLRLRTGITIYPRAAAEHIVGAAVDRGFAVAIHAIGNEAIDTALAAYATVGSRLDRAGVPRLEHAAFANRELAARMADLGVAAVSQPHFVSLPSFDHAASVPGLRFLAHRWLLDAGVEVAGSSDHPVAGFGPLDGIRSAVSRRSTSGRVYEADQRVGLDEALAMYTRTAAKVCGCLDRCGTLEVGKRADLVVLDGALPEARVRATVIGGEVAFLAPGA